MPNDMKLTIGPQSLLSSLGQALASIRSEEDPDLRSDRDDVEGDGGPIDLRRSRASLVPLAELPGVVAVVSGDRTTYPQFSQSVACLKTPRGTTLLWITASAGRVAASRNELIKGALERGAGWVFFLDDDHLFSTDLLDRLLRRNVDVVVPAVCLKTPPHRLVAWPPFEIRATDTEAELLAAFVKQSAATLSIGERRPGSGLIELGHCGAAGLLVSARVLRELPQPWFEFGHFENAAGEDTWFSLKARRVGFQVFCDLSVPMGHLATCAIWPSEEPGVITPKIEFQFDGNIRREKATTAMASEENA